MESCVRHTTERAKNLLKRTFTFLFFFTIPIFAQTYLVVSYNNSDPANNSNLSSLQKITFNGTNITFLLTDNSTIPTVGFVDGHGNSNSWKNYSFTDSPSNGTRFTYRLKQIDNDGKYHYSSIVEVEVGVPKQNELRQNYPNPFNPYTKIDYNLQSDDLVTLKVFDVLGREVASLVNEIKKAGSYEVIFDSRTTAGGLVSGIYFCRMSSTNYFSSIKMLIMK